MHQITLNHRRARKDAVARFEQTLSYESEARERVKSASVLAFFAGLIAGVLACLIFNV